MISTNKSFYFVSKFMRVTSRTLIDTWNNYILGVFSNNFDKWTIYIIAANALFFWYFKIKTVMDICCQTSSSLAIILNLMNRCVIWDEEINSSILKYGESTASDVSLKKLIPGSLLSSIKIFSNQKN